MTRSTARQTVEPTNGSEPEGEESFVIRLPPDLRSVGQARAKLTELARTWGISGEELDDTRVVLSELMSNGVLHARTELEVVLSQRGRGVRVEVRDASAVPVLPPFTSTPMKGSLLDSPDSLASDGSAPPAATGRGLSMVAALATAWGWFPDASGGKVVWAEMGMPSPSEPMAEQASARASYAVRPVRLIAVPQRLLKASEDHLDDLFRELQMANLVPSAERGEDIVGQLAPVAEQVKAGLARMREPVRRAIWESARRGDRLVDINLLADSGTPRVFAELEEMLSMAGRASLRGALLTEPPSPEVVEWRRWLRGELESQIAGKPPRACPFPVTPVVDGPRGLAFEAQDLARSKALESLRTALAAGHHDVGAGAAPGFADDRAMVRALETVIDFLGARRSVLSLLGEDNETVHFGASVGFSSDVAEYWQAHSLSADLPASEAIRTNRPVLFRTFAELDARYPVFLSTPSESDPALACVPLNAGRDRAFGCMVLGFPQARDFSPRETAFLEQLARELSVFIFERRERLEGLFANQRNLDVDKAVASIGVAPSREVVLRKLVESAVGLVCDGAAVHVAEANGSVRYLSARHRDPERLGAVVALLQKRQHRPGDRQSNDMINECIRTGQVTVVQSMSDEAVMSGALDEEDVVLIRRVAMGSLGVMPVRGKDHVVAVLSFCNNAGRFISEEDIAALGRLAGAAGEHLAQLGY